MENCAAMAWNDGKKVSIEKGPAMESAASKTASPAWRLLCGSAVGAFAELAQPLCSVFTALENLHQRRANHDSVNMTTEHFNLLTSANTEPGTNRYRSQLTRPVQVVYDFRRNGDVLAGRPGHGNRIHKTLTCGTQRLEPTGFGHGRHHLHERDLVGIQTCTQLSALVQGEIGHNQSGNTGLGGSGRELLDAERQQRVQVAHQKQRGLQPWHGFQLCQNPTQ